MSEQRTRRGMFTLPTISRATNAGANNAGIPRKCIWKCDAACFHEAPNEQAAAGRYFGNVLSRRLGRRTLLKGAAAATVPLVASATPVGGALLGGSPLSPQPASAAVSGKSLGFSRIQLNTNDTVTVPVGYTSKVLLRWGDPLSPGVERMTQANVSASLQEQTFGWNCDLNLYFPMTQATNGLDSGGLLWVNHEYTEGERMFASYDSSAPTKAQVDIELAAHGGTLVELKRTGQDWAPVLSSPFNRRVTATTEMEITGPLAGDDRLKTSADPTGRFVQGTLNNCAGGRTPWGTVLTAEENFHQYFANNDDNPDADLKAINERYGVPGGSSSRHWEDHYDRFDLSKEPNEINRFGFIVEVDPFDPTFQPKKRTALGRTKHEAATPAMANDGRVVFYSGDDERFDYLYKFVTHGKYVPEHREANFGLLDSGDLYAARFDDDGTGTWLLLRGGEGALKDWSHEDVLLNTRGAGDAVGATPMDRPEDVEVNPRNNRVYVALTNNTRREAGDEDGANPRPDNTYGHVLELSEDGGDMAATGFTWEMFLLCGPRENADTFYGGYDKTQVSTIATPDNLAFDERGNLWIATDGQPGTLNLNDTIFAVPTAGPDRGKVQAFLSVPRGAEVCGPEFTPDYRSLFANVQHPGEASADPNSPQSVWPDGVWPPLPSLVVVTKQSGGRIGS